MHSPGVVGISRAGGYFFPEMIGVLNRNVEWVFNPDRKKMCPCFSVCARDEQIVDFFS